MKGKPPQILEDLYRDLRDRHLLPVVVVLVAAIVAVPFVLGGGGDAPLPTGAGSSIANDGVEEAPEAQPVVLAQNPTLRDFEERLESFRSRNPFKQKFAKPPKSALEDLEQQDLGSIGDGASTADLGIDPGTSTTSPEPIGSEPTGSEPTGGSGSSKPKLVLFDIRANVRVGPAGDTRKINDVEYLDYLPGRKRPVVQFVGGSIDGKKAAFIVSSDVSNVEGDGRCAPRPQRCEFLMMKVGDEVKLDYDLEGRVYRLRLDKVHMVRHKGKDAPGLERGSSSSAFGRVSP